MRGVRVGLNSYESLVPILEACHTELSWDVATPASLASSGAISYILA